MIFTLTLNPAMDKTVVIENFNPGSANRNLWCPKAEEYLPAN